MIESGLVEEARELLPYKNLKPLQTVGYRELFEHFEGNCSLDESIEKIEQHSRNFAKRQLTWYKKKSEFKWLKTDELKAENVLNSLGVDY